MTKATGEAQAALPHAGLGVLDGHGHVAPRRDPAMVAVIRGFVAS